MKKCSHTNIRTSAISSGIATLCFAIVSYGHYYDGETSQGILFLALTLSQFCLCMRSLGRMKKEAAGENCEQEGEYK